ncbi:MAG: hypothetical protein HY723_06580 [Chloroflexi bacterium]|nr:hypothetical protein [Chloroflexota bacterium]
MMDGLARKLAEATSRRRFLNAALTKVTAALLAAAAIGALRGTAAANHGQHKCCVYLSKRSGRCWTNCKPNPEAGCGEIEGNILLGEHVVDSCAECHSKCINE